MPLIKDGRFAADDWTRPDPAVEFSGVAADKLILTPAALTEHGGRLASARVALGVELPNNFDIEALDPWIRRLVLVSVLFPKSADGRGFSMATRLRRLGFKGELRATGHLIADQYALARSCGFDTVEIPEALAARQPEPHWMQAQQAMSLAYQRGYGPMQNILSARWTRT
jgi:uncharacterized protein (DUF934 family)